MKQFLVFLSAFLFIASAGLAQEKAKITIRKNVDGEETVTEREVDIDDIEDLEKFLEDEGIDIDIDIDSDGNSRVLEVIVDEESESEPFRFQAGCHTQTRAFLGVYGDTYEEGGGAKVTEVIEGTSAEDMGLQVDDIITAFNGEEISSFGDLREAVLDAEAGSEVEIIVQRNGKRKKIKGDVGEKDHSDNPHFWMKGNDFHYEFDEEKLESLLEDLEIKLEGFKDGENFHFEFDSEDWEEWSQELEKKMEAWGEEFGEEFSEQYEDSYRTRTVVIIMEEISSEELEEVNENAEPKLRTDNDLDLAALRFFPNPGDGNFELSFETPDQGDLNLMIFDAQGKKVYFEMLGDFQGRYENEIDISRRPAGNYFLQIEQGGKTYSKKIVKE